MPDDVEHRMGWRVPPTVLDLGDPRSAAAVLHRDTEPIGPVLGVLTVTDAAEIAAALPPSCADGVAWVHGFAGHRVPDLPHGRIVTGPAADLAGALTIPPSWLGRAR